MPESRTYAPLWGGRFSATPEGALELFGASLGFDQRLWPYDIAGSRAHAKMLGAQEILSAQDVDAILQGLDQVAAAIKAGELAFDPAQDEDVHMAVERAQTFASLPRIRRGRSGKPWARWRRPALPGLGRRWAW